MVADTVIGDNDVFLLISVLLQIMLRLFYAAVHVSVVLVAVVDTVVFLLYVVHFQLFLLLLLLLQVGK